MEMEPLQTIKQVLTVLCVYPAPVKTSQWLKLLYTLVTVLVVAANLAGLIASLVFFFEFVSSDFESSLHALLQICALSAATYMHAIGLFSRHRIKIVFENLGKIYEASKRFQMHICQHIQNIIDTHTISDMHSDSFQFMEQANNHSEFISKMYLKLVLVGFFMNTLTMSAFSLIFCWITNAFTAGFESKYVYHPFRVL